MQFSQNHAYLILIFTIITQLCFAIPIPEQTEEYNYFATDLIIVSDADGRNGLIGRPVSDEEYRHNTGNIVYSYIIKYVDEFEPNEFDQSPPQFTLHLSGGGKYRAIGVTESWLTYAEKIAFMEEEDAETLVGILDAVLTDDDLPDEEVGGWIRRGIRQETANDYSEEESIAEVKDYYEKLRPWYEEEYRSPYPGAKFNNKPIEQHEYKDDEFSESGKLVTSKDIEPLASDKKTVTIPTELERENYDHTKQKNKEPLPQSLANDITQKPTSGIEVLQEPQSNKISNTTPANKHNSSTSHPYWLYIVATMILIAAFLFLRKR